MNNISFYIENLDDNENFCYIENFSKKFLNDPRNNVSIFFKNIGKNLSNFNIACFPSVNLWDFSGKLFVLNVYDIVKCKNIVNNININYIFGIEEMNPVKIFILLKELNSLNMYAYSKPDKVEAKRLFNMDIEIL